MDIQREADIILNNKRKKTRWRYVVTSCPICGKEARSLHHIKPIRVGGEDIPRNRIILCSPCHDIVEEIYDETGIEYCPALAHHLRLELDSVTHNAIRRFGGVMKGQKLRESISFLRKRVG